LPRSSPGQTSARFQPSGRLAGSFTPPADKSISHRAALFGAMADEPVSVRNYLRAADTESTLNAVRALGAGVDEQGDELVIRGVGLHTPAEVTGGVLDVGNSGTLMRLLPGWLAGQPGAEWTLDGDESIRRRPMGRIAEPLRLMGAGLDTQDGGLPPIRVRGSALAGIDYSMPMASAQVKTCVLIAGLLASGTTSVTEPSMSRDHTERLLTRARVPFSREGLSVTVHAVDELELDDVVVPGDPSSAAFLAVAACLVPGSRIVIDGMCLNWTRTGFFRIAQRMGAVILGDLERPGEGAAGDEPIGELDELPLVALLGCFAEGDTVVRGAEELRVKETDRIAGVVEGLNGLGASLEATDDGFVVHGGTGIEGGTIDSRGDHRMAMLGAVAGLASRSGVEVLGMDAAAVSYPDFERDLRELLER
jgi:3-phosphoshikimate 1-carboxyvinyltransferase